jgi:thymidylate synthase ThyX
MITAKIIADSISEAGKRIITLQLHYPKFIHGEFMTHRMFSRNASSSRAIPFEKMVADIEADMAMPVYWGSNQQGMQAGEEIDLDSIELAKRIWQDAFHSARKHATSLYDLGVHKQIVNRLLEPFYNINTLVTATEWDNFFELRDHPDAQPEIRALAIAMKKAIAESKPIELYKYEWHLPYVQRMDMALYSTDIETLIKISVARCARVSYLTHEQKEPKVEDDLKLYDRLVGGTPLHASPAEHQATPDWITYFGAGGEQWQKPKLWGNLRGWIQYRQMLEKEPTLSA